MITDEIKLVPCSIDIKGIKPVIEKISKVYTKEKNFNNLKNSMSGSVELEKINDVYLAQSNIDYFIPVDSYTEIEKKVPITILNLPDSVKGLIMPSQATIILNVTSEKYNSMLNKKIILTVDYNDRYENISSKFRINANNLGDGIIVKSLSPQYVDILIEYDK